MEYKFESYDSFLNEYKKYHFHSCDKCGALRELSEESVDIIIEDRIMHFKELLVLKCTKCSSICLPMHSKQMINGCYKIMLEEGHYEGIHKYRGYKKKFEYCKDKDFIYDHRDYYNIPGLCYDEEHSIEGFLTPVYFSNKVLLYFLNDPDYHVKLNSETYGYFELKGKWGIPFGINRNGKVVFWLGDLSYLDNKTLDIMKPHNIESDHKLIDSEFYMAQMCCIWSEPNKEIRICLQKEQLFKCIESNYGISLFHLDDEIRHQIETYQKPIVFTEKTIEPTINMLHKVLIEGVNIAGFRALYRKLYSEPCDKYKDWKSIKFYEALLQKVLKPTDDIKNIIAPLYLLNDFRQYYDHLLSYEKKEEIKRNILVSLDVKSFDNIEEIYLKLLNKLSILFEYLIIGYGR
ncbi:MAG: hypothetical protein E7216_05505 [Clostridium thermopalmarium]|mgnify:CR=1 FL=1|jgi:hypothetical protein|uniref:hypothetical protein n=1 Tax=Clostridium thermopalmarium TaxID=29373 RepID=UPI002353601A|nr:hypothetical protein [Clostridium thermopalmarium]MBE6043675.1 hypothetical protein [Clostridium thermopalmarium]